MAKTQGFGSHPENINRKGRPKRGETLTDILRKKLDKKLSKEQKLKIKEMIIDRLIDKALKDKDMKALEYLYNRVEGKPTEKVEVTEKVVEIIDDDDDLDTSDRDDC